MSPYSFYPYRTAAEQIRFEIEASDPDLRRGNDGSLLAYGDGPDALEIGAFIAVPDSVFEKVIAPAERADPPLDVQLLYQGVESRKRRMTAVPGDGIHETTLTLRRRDWRGVVEMRAVLVRNRDGIDLPAGYASARGTLVAWSAPRRVLFDEPSRPRGGQLPVRWEDFARSASRWRRENTDSLFALDTSGDTPVVILNSGIPHAYPVLHSTGARGARARIRDATYSTIVHQVWSSLLGIALAQLTRTAPPQGEGYMDSEERLRLVGGWQEGILLDWSIYLYPDRDPESALEGIVLAADDAIAMADLMGRLPNAIQKRLRTVRGFEGLVREAEGM